MTTLYHFTCDHAHLLLGKTGTLLPGCLLNGPDPRHQHRHVEVPFQTSLVWATDLRYPNRDALGLTSYLLQCDRTAHRYRLLHDDETGMVPWTDVRRQMFTRGLGDVVYDLEEAPGVRPRHWWVSSRPVAVEYDPLPVGGAR
jgi:hypothetical protein